MLCLLIISFIFSFIVGNDEFDQFIIDAENKIPKSPASLEAIAAKKFKQSILKNQQFQNLNSMINLYHHINIGTFDKVLDKNHLELSSSFRDCLNFFDLENLKELFEFNKAALIPNGLIYLKNYRDIIFLNTNEKTSTHISRMSNEYNDLCKSGNYVIIYPSYVIQKKAIVAMIDINQREVIKKIEVPKSHHASLIFVHPETTIICQIGINENNIWTAVFYNLLTEQKTNPYMLQTKLDFFDLREKFIPIKDGSWIFDDWNRMDAPINYVRISLTDPNVSIIKLNNKFQGYVDTISSDGLLVRHIHADNKDYLITQSASNSKNSYCAYNITHPKSHIKFKECFFLDTSNVILLYKNTETRDLVRKLSILEKQYQKNKENSSDTAAAILSQIRSNTYPLCYCFNIQNKTYTPIHSDKSFSLLSRGSYGCYRYVLAGGATINTDILCLTRQKEATLQFIKKEIKYWAKFPHEILTPNQIKNQINKNKDFSPWHKSIGIIQFNNSPKLNIHAYTMDID